MSDKKRADDDKPDSKETAPEDADAPTEDEDEDDWGDDPTVQLQAIPDPEKDQGPSRNKCFKR